LTWDLTWDLTWSKMNSTYRKGFGNTCNSLPFWSMNCRFGFDTCSWI
jgi:hypothetical protein